MKTIISKLFGPRQALKDKSLSAIDLQNHLGTARQNLLDIVARIERLEDQRVELAGEDDVTRQNHRAALTEGRDDLADAEALVIALEKRLTIVSQQEAQTSKQVALSRAQDAVKKLGNVGERYNAAAAQIVTILREIALAERLIEAANRDLPDGAGRIQGAENTLRAAFGHDTRLLSRKIEPGWARPGTGGRDRLDAGKITIRNIRDHGDGTGTLYGTNGAVIDVERYDYEVTEVLVPQTHRIPDSLFKTLALPSFAIDDPAPFTPLGSSNPDANALVRHLDELAQRTPRRPPEDRVETRSRVIGPVNRNGPDLIAAE